ncbi:hypothetical protein ACQPZF_16800 [Actinosynnema sp. CS-041913]|uniref:hypothetical protein n=1 Tax=Actinosynnema sp. CS-041913 TaxID=3239917 RepID=UPI003D8C7264
MSSTTSRSLRQVVVILLSVLLGLGVFGSHEHSPSFPNHGVDHSADHDAHDDAHHDDAHDDAQEDAHHDEDHLRHHDEDHAAGDDLWPHHHGVAILGQRAGGEAPGGHGGEPHRAPVRSEATPAESQSTRCPAPTEVSTVPHLRSHPSEARLDTRDGTTTRASPSGIDLLTLVCVSRR